MRLTEISRSRTGNELDVVLEMALDLALECHREGRKLAPSGGGFGFVNNTLDCHQEVGSGVSSGSWLWRFRK